MDQALSLVKNGELQLQNSNKLKNEIETILWSKHVVIAVLYYEFEKTLFKYRWQHSKLCGLYCYTTTPLCGRNPN
jgi:hypothetical protein